MRPQGEPELETSDSTKRAETGQYDETELDLMDQVPTPRFNPWLVLILLMLSGFLYVWIWGVLLRG